MYETSLAQSEAGGCHHPRVGERPFQQAAPTAAYIKNVARARYSSGIEMIIDLTQLSR